MIGVIVEGWPHITFAQVFELDGITRIYKGLGGDITVYSINNLDGFWLIFIKISWRREIFCCFGVFYKKNSGYYYDNKSGNKENGFIHND